MTDLTSIPAGWKLVHPSLEDLDKVTDYQISHDIAVFGKPDTTQADMEYEWERDGFQVDRDAWMLLSPDGKLAGYTDFWQNEDELYINHMTNIHPDYRHLISPLLFYRMALEKAQVPGAEAVKRVRTISVEPSTEMVLAAEGFTAIQVQWRMVHTFSEPPQPPAWPAGYDLRPFNREVHAREVFEVIETAFSELPHREGNTFAGWQNFVLNRSDFNPTLLKMVVKDDEVVAVAVGLDNEIGGWIKQLAVKKAHRGKGLAYCLLKQLFFEFYLLGRADVGLTVDSENLTGAPELYRKVGMQATEKYVTFEKDII